MPAHSLPKATNVKNHKPGTLVPIVKTLPYAVDPVEYFEKLSECGDKHDSLLFESSEIVPGYGEKSLGSANPCLKVVGRGEHFEILALNDTGRRFLDFMRDDFSFCDEVKYLKDRIMGRMKPGNTAESEAERLKSKNHMDIIRAIVFKFTPASKPFVPYAGLFGCISYDFIDQFEQLPKSRKDILQDPDYLLYFLDNLFLVDHKENKTFLVANALVTGSAEEAYAECASTISRYKEALKKKLPEPRKKAGKTGCSPRSDTSREEFTALVRRIKEHIVAGDVYQAVMSRAISLDFKGRPIEAYKNLRKINPSPYMFFINSAEGALIGASPEMSLRVGGEKTKTVEIRPIAGTKPRGLVDGKIDPDLDSRYETELKIDPKETSEHTMLVDLARNDIARISKPGTRFVDTSFVVEKYSHVQHLVSNVKGVLREDLDALHAYLATMNMGTLTGAPKVEAMKLARLYEKTKRGFYGGAVGYVTPSGELDTAIIIRSVRIKGNRASIRVGAGIVHDSDPESEFLETERKAQACLKALEMTTVAKGG